MSEAANLKRDNTMVVTAQQGKEFLESHGMKVTDDDVKTRGQKEMLDQIVSSSDGQEEQNNNSENNNDDAESSEAQNEADAEVPANNGDSEADGPPKVTREGTMVITAKEGQALLEGEELEKTRGQTAAASKSPVTSPSAKFKRTTTIAQTTHDSSNILGQEERGRTRSQTRKFSESGEEEKKVPAVKRAGTMEQTIKAGEEYLENEAKRANLDSEKDNIPEAKRAKVDSEKDKIPEVEEAAATDEATAEA